MSRGDSCGTAPSPGKVMTRSSKQWGLCHRSLLPMVGKGWCSACMPAALRGAPLDPASACVSNVLSCISSCWLPENRDEKPGLLGQQLHSQTGRKAPLQLLIFSDLQVQRTLSASTLVPSPVSCPASPGAAGSEKTPKLLPKFVRLVGMSPS